MRFFNKQAIESLDLKDIQKAVAHAYSLVLEV